MSSPDNPFFFALFLIAIIEGCNILMAQHAACFRYSDNCGRVTRHQVGQQCNLSVLNEFGAQILFIILYAAVHATKLVFGDCYLLSFSSPVNHPEYIEPVGIKTYSHGLWWRNYDDVKSRISLTSCIVF